MLTIHADEREEKRRFVDPSEFTAALNRFETKYAQPTVRATMTTEEKIAQASVMCGSLDPPIPDTDPDGHDSDDDYQPEAKKSDSQLTWGVLRKTAARAIKNACDDAVVAGLWGARMFPERCYCSLVVCLFSVAEYKERLTKLLIVRCVRGFRARQDTSTFATCKA